MRQSDWHEGGEEFCIDPNGVMRVRITPRDRTKVYRNHCRNMLLMMLQLSSPLLMLPKEQEEGVYADPSNQRSKDRGRLFAVPCAALACS